MNIPGLKVMLSLIPGVCKLLQAGVTASNNTQLTALPPKCYTSNLVESVKDTSTLQNFAADVTDNEKNYPASSLKNVPEVSDSEIPDTNSGDSSNGAAKLGKQEKEDEDAIKKVDKKIKATASASAARGTWTVCAEEGDDCKCHGTVVYGRKFLSGNKKAKASISELKAFPHKEMAVSGTIECSKNGISNAVIDQLSKSTRVRGTDPAKGYTKHCMCREETAGETERAQNRRSKDVASPQKLMSEKEEKRLSIAEKRLALQGHATSIPGLDNATKEAHWSPEQKRRIQLEKKKGKDIVAKNAGETGKTTASFLHGFAAGHKAGLKKKCGSRSGSRRLLAPMPADEKAHLLAEETSDRSQAAKLNARAEEIAILLKRGTDLSLAEQMTVETQPGGDDFRLLVSPQGPLGQGQATTPESPGRSQSVGEGRSNSTDDRKSIFLQAFHEAYDGDRSIIKESSKPEFHTAFHEGFMTAMQGKCPDGSGVN